MQDSEDTTVNLMDYPVSSLLGNERSVIPSVSFELDMIFSFLLLVLSFFICGLGYKPEANMIVLCK